MTVVEFANPYLRCDECGGWVAGYRWRSNLNAPCGCRAGVSSACHSWSPVDGCRCDPAEHPEPAA